MKCMRDGALIPQNGHVEPKNDDLPMALALPYFKIKTQEVDHPVALFISASWKNNSSIDSSTGWVLLLLPFTKLPKIPKQHSKLSYIY